MTWMIIVFSLSLLALIVSIVAWITCKNPPIKIEKLTEDELKARQDLFARESLKAYTRPKRKQDLK